MKFVVVAFSIVFVRTVGKVTCKFFGKLTVTIAETEVPIVIAF